MKPDPKRKIIRAKSKPGAKKKQMKPKRKHPLPEGVTKETWLDKQDVMMRMYISSRTLQEWRKNGRLPYSRIGKKFYYPQSGLDRLLLDGMQ